MFYKGKDEGIPDDVHEIFFSGNFWYAASEDRLKDGRPKACGVGNTEEEAIADMRDLVSRYVPVKERQSPWDLTQKYAAPNVLGEHRNPVLSFDQRVKLADGREAVVADRATHRKSRTLQIDGERDLKVVKLKEIVAYKSSVTWVECSWD